MSANWWGVLGSSAAIFTLKYFGHALPAKYLSHRRFQTINSLIPIALLSALVAVQSFTERTKLTLDHRAIGLAVALLALFLRAPFPLVVISAALSSGIFYHLYPKY